MEKDASGTFSESQYVGKTTHQQDSASAGNTAIVACVVSRHGELARKASSRSEFEIEFEIESGKRSER